VDTSVTTQPFRGLAARACEAISVGAFPPYPHCPPAEEAVPWLCRAPAVQPRLSGASLAAYARIETLAFAATKKLFIFDNIRHMS
jgi:hypothetical protein